MYISDPSPHYMLCMVPQIMAEFYGKVSRWEAQRYPRKEWPTQVKWTLKNDPKQGHSDWHTLLGLPVPPQCPPYDGPRRYPTPQTDPVSTPSLPKYTLVTLFHPPPPYTCETPPGHSNFRHWSFCVSGQQCMGRLQDTHRWEEEDLFWDQFKYPSTPLNPPPPCPHPLYQYTDNIYTYIYIYRFCVK